jgi:Cupin
MTSGKGAVRPFPNYGIAAKILARDLSPLRVGGGGEISCLVCGYLTCDPHLCRPILNGLPSVFTVNIRTDPSGHWLESSIIHLVEEAASGRVGSDAMLAKLSEALFVDTLRRYVASLPGQQTGWLTGARDPIVGKSLGLLHSRVAHPWTIADLAGEVGVSRSALVERFTRFLAEPPMTYLTRGGFSWPCGRSRRHRAALRTSPPKSGTNRRRRSAGPSNVSSGSLRADTGAIAEKRPPPPGLHRKPSRRQAADHDENCGVRYE